uniref:Uncharacterized protein n=1 Tax=Hanusia phi TaxID=3032 RepID=A0A7S0HB90_9CRYP
MHPHQGEYHCPLFAVQKRRQAALLKRSKLLASDDTKSSNPSVEDGETFLQQDKSIFLQKMDKILRNYRLLKTGSSERQKHPERHHAVVIPAGLQEGQSFRLKIVNLGEFTVQVPKGAMGGSTLSVVIPSAAGQVDWAWALQLAVGNGDALVAMENLHQHFDDSQIFTEACKSIVRIVEAEESSKRRAEFCHLGAVEMIVLGAHQHRKEEEAVVAGAQALSSLFFASFNSTIAGANVGAGKLLLDLLLLHTESAAVREFALAALCNLCATGEGCRSLKESSDPQSKPSPVDVSIHAMIKSLDAHTILEYGCQLLFRMVQGDARLLKLFLSADRARSLSSIHTAWKKSAGTSGGVDYCGLLVHTTTRKSIKK